MSIPTDQTTASGKSFARDLRNDTDLRDDLRTSRSVAAKDVEFENAPADHAIEWAYIRRDLVEIVNTAVRVGRGTETIKNLAAMLEPYGVRRKA